MKIFKFFFLIFFLIITIAKANEYNKGPHKNYQISFLQEFKEFNYIKKKKTIEYFLIKNLLKYQKNNIIKTFYKNYEKTIFLSHNVEFEYTFFLKKNYNKQLYFYFDEEISRVSIQDADDKIFFLKKIDSNTFFLDKNNFNFYKINFFSGTEVINLNLYISENFDNNIISYLKNNQKPNQKLKSNKKINEDKIRLINFFVSFVFFYFNILICCIFFKKIKRIIIPISEKKIYYIYNFILTIYLLFFLFYDLNIYSDLFLVLFIYFNLFIFKLNKNIFIFQLSLFYCLAIYFYFYDNFMYFKLFESLSYLIVFSLISFLFLNNNYIFLQKKK